MTMRSRYSRIHYRQFARIVSAMRENADADAIFTLSYVHEFTDKLITTFSRDNPQFDCKRFLDACGISPTSRTRG